MLDSGEAQFTAQELIFILCDVLVKGCHGEPNRGWSLPGPGVSLFPGAKFFAGKDLRLHTESTVSLDPRPSRRYLDRPIEVEEVRGCYKRNS